MRNSGDLKYLARINGLAMLGQWPNHEVALGSAYTVSFP